MEPASRLYPILGAACVALLLSLGCSRKPEGTDAPQPMASDEPVGATSVLSLIPADARPPPPARSAGTPLHHPMGGEFEFVFAEKGGGVAFVGAQGAERRVVFNGAKGKPYAAIGQLALSPDGRRCAYPALKGGRWRMVVDGAEEGRTFDAVKRPSFSRDGAHLAYQAMDGERWYLVVDGRANSGTPGHYLEHDLGADGSRIAYVEAEEGGDRGRLYVADAAFASRVEVAGGVTEFAVSEDGTRWAAVAVDEGGAQVVNAPFSRPEQAARGPRFRMISNLTFGGDAGPLAYVAERDGARVAVSGDRQVVLPGGALVGPLVVRQGGRSLAALMLAENGSVVARGFFEPVSAGEESFEEAEGLVFSADDRVHALAARDGDRWHVVANGRAGPPFDRAVTPQFSPDGRFLIYRARLSGKRFVVVADQNGRLVAQHRAYEQVFPVRVTAGGRAVAYGAKDGQRLLWVVERL